LKRIVIAFIRYRLAVRFKVVVVWRLGATPQQRFPLPSRLFFGVCFFHHQTNIDIGEFFHTTRKTQTTVKTNIASTALVGVFTNKTHIQKTISQHSPCWCFHQQDSHTENNITSTALVGVITNKTHIQKTISQAQPLLVFSPTRLTCRKQYHSTALVGVITNKIQCRKQDGKISR
jgi:hypothetical protein